jgi:hypothetical protein
MPMQVVNGAQLICVCGSVPSILTVLPVHRELDQNQFAANIMDHVPMINIMPFGVCVKLAGPCVPATPAPWVPGAVTVILDGAPALDNISTLACTLGGIITVLNPGQTTTMIP